MKMDKIADLIDANGRCMREFAEFMKEAKPKQLDALRRMLKVFNRRGRYETDDFEPYAIQGAVESMALSLASGEGDASFKKRARRLGENLSCAVYNLYATKAPKLDFDHFIYFISHLGQAFGSPIEIMRKMVNGEAVSAEPAISLTNLSESLDAAEPKGDEETVPDTTMLERKFDEFEKEPGPTPVTLFVGDHNSIDLTREEFKYTIDRLRRRRRGEEDPEAWVKRIVTAIFRPHDSPKPLVETSELVPDPDAMEECLTAIRKAVASVKPHAEPKAQAVASGDAQALVDEMLATFDKLTAVLARQREAQPQE